MTITFVATRKEGLKPGNDPSDGNRAHECVSGNVAAMVTSTDAFRNSDTFQQFKEQNRDEPSMLFRSSAGDKFTDLGLIGTALEAYNTHQNLVLRPDDIWHTILTQFCAHVNANAEALRHKLVRHQDGKKKLVVVDPNADPTSADYAWFIQALVDEMTQHLVDDKAEKESLKDWFLPGFSTTTDRDQVCAAASLLCTMQSYFVYEMLTMCGIPKVTLEGTVEDWKRLRSKVDRLSEFDVPLEGNDTSPYSDQWVPALKLICDNLVESAQHGSTNNLDFWESMISEHGGSGGPYLRGWMVCFSFFDHQGQPNVRIDMDRVRNQGQWPKRRLGSCNPNIVSCPVTIRNLASGHAHKARLFVGQMSYDVHNDADNEQDNTEVFSKGLTDEEKKVRTRLVPRNDWVLCVDTKLDNGGTEQ